MITYNKLINSLQCYSSIDGYTDVVFTINWTFVATENNLNASLPCSTQVPVIAGQEFIPYADLTEAQVLAWIDEYTAPEIMQSYMDQLAGNIEQQKTIVNPPLPWQPTLE